MNDKIKKDIKDIFIEYLDEELITSIISDIERILVDSEGAVDITTRNKNDKKLKYQGDYYFTLKRKKNNKNILYGGIVTRFSGDKVPAVILSDNNPLLNMLSGENIVPIASSRYAGKKGLVINNHTINAVYDSIVHDAVRHIHRDVGDVNSIKYHQELEKKYPNYSAPDYKAPEYHDKKSERKYKGCPPVIPVIVSIIAAGILAYLLLKKGNE